MKNKRNLLFVLGFLMLSICVVCYILFALPYLLGAIGGYEHESMSPNNLQKLKAFGCMRPVLSIYILAIIFYFLGRIRAYSAFVFPIMVIIGYTLLCGLGVCVCGFAFGWMIIFTILPALVGTIVAIVLGVIRDVVYRRNSQLMCGR